MTYDPVPPPREVRYHDRSHRYYMDGVMCRNVSSVAKIPIDTWTLDQWSKRSVALGMALDRNLCENILVDPDSWELGNEVAEQALRAAKTHHKADRGTQMHRALELTLLGRPEGLLSEQQRADAAVLQATLDRYGLRPHQGMAEQFVAWPHHRVGGRFDAILEKPDGRLLLVDLKSGQNAVLYPDATACQLALYARAPWMSDGVEIQGDKTIITNWRPMPEKLDLRYGYVLLVPPDAKIGTLHEVNLEYGWHGAHLALQTINWRKKRGEVVREVPYEDPPTALITYVDLAAGADTVEELRKVWRDANADGRLDSALLTAIDARRAELGVSA